MSDPAFDLHPALPDDTMIEWVRLPTVIRNALEYAGLKTIGEIREMSDSALRNMPGLGPGSLKWLRARAGWHKTNDYSNKITWAKVGRVTEPGRYMYRFGWLIITADDLRVWQHFPEAAFTLVKTQSPDVEDEFRLGIFDLQE